MIDQRSEEKVRRRVFVSSIYVARWNWSTRNFHQSIEESLRQMISINRSHGTFRIHTCFFRGKELRGSFSRWAPDEKLNGKHFERLNWSNEWWDYSAYEFLELSRQMMLLPSYSHSNRSYHFGSRQRAMASRGFKDLWAKASLQYALSIFGAGKEVSHLIFQNLF